MMRILPHTREDWLKFLGMRAAPRPVFVFLVVLGAIAVIVAFLLPTESRPSWLVQREEQRRIVRERVQGAGGWDALRRESVAAFGSFTTNSIRWSSHIDSESKIPSAILLLKPEDVAVYALPGEPAIARIKIFGRHSTGARGIPYYGLWIVCSSAPDNYTPKLDFRGVTITGKIQKIAESIFEVY